MCLSLSSLMHRHIRKCCNYFVQWLQSKLLSLPYDFTKLRSSYWLKSIPGKVYTHFSPPLPQPAMAAATSPANSTTLVIPYSKVPAGPHRVTVKISYWLDVTSSKAFSFTKVDVPLSSVELAVSELTATLDQKIMVRAFHSEICLNPLAELIFWF